MGISPGIMNFYTLCTTVYGLNHPTFRGFSPPNLPKNARLDCSSLIGDMAGLFRGYIELVSHGDSTQATTLVNRAILKFKCNKYAYLIVRNNFYCTPRPNISFNNS